MQGHDFCLPSLQAEGEKSCAACDPDLRSLASSSVSNANFDKEQRGGKWTSECGMTSGKLQCLHLTKYFT